MKSTNKVWLSATLLSLSLTGCGGGGSSSSGGDSDSGDRDAGGTSDVKVVEIDATDYNSYTYFNLETGKTVALSAAEAETSTDWHIGFRRDGVILNGGNSGSGNVAGALAAAQDNFYDGDEPDENVFLNASAADELEQLTATYDLGSLSFLSDEPSPAIKASEAVTGTNIDMGWYNYNVVSHAISLNDNNWWLLRSAEGDSFAKFHASDLTYARETGLEVTFEFDVQPSGNSQFTTDATFNAVIGPAGGEACFDFDSDSTVDCSNTTWDLKLEIAGRSWTLWTNSGISGNGSGGAFGPLSTDDADEYTSAVIAPTGQPIANHYATDSNASVFEANSWYAYNLEGNHKLWPNYRAYLIDTDTTNPDSAKYAFQISSYYSDAGVSGFPYIRYIAH